MTIARNEPIVIGIENGTTINITTQKALTPKKELPLKNGDKVTFVVLSTRTIGNRRCRMYIGHKGYTTSSEEVTKAFPEIRFN